MATAHWAPSSFLDHSGTQWANSLVVSGSEVNWAQSCPSLQHILNHYKRLYNVDVTTSSSSSGNEDDSGRGGWQKQVMKADDGSHFYLDEQEEYIPCTAEGTSYPPGPQTDDTQVAQDGSSAAPTVEKSGGRGHSSGSLVTV